MGDLFERSPWSQLGSSITRDRLIRGDSIRQTDMRGFHPCSYTPSCQQCIPIWTYTYTHIIHACIYASCLDVLILGGGNRRERKRKLMAFALVLNVVTLALVPRAVCSQCTTRMMTSPPLSPFRMPLWWQQWQQSLWWRWLWHYLCSSVRWRTEWQW